MRHYAEDKHRFVHQLDNATSGVLVTARTKAAAGAAAKLFRDRLARKQYLALVFGHPDEDEWTVTAPLSRDPDDPTGFRERVDLDGKACETHFSVLRRGVMALDGKFKGTPVSKVLATPVTGRRHQIRVHLKHSGHPIVGDNAYSEDTDSFRTFLHAHVLELPFDEQQDANAEGKTSKVKRRRENVGAGDGGVEKLGTMRFVAEEPESFDLAIS